MQTSKELEALRKYMQKIDEDIISLALIRLDIAKRIGNEKRRLGLEVFQPSVEKSVIEHYRMRMKDEGYAPDFGEELAKCLIAQSKAVQQDDNQ